MNFGPRFWDKLEGQFEVQKPRKPMVVKRRPFKEKPAAPAELPERITDVRHFLLNYKTLPPAPAGILKGTCLTGLIFGKLLVADPIDAHYFGARYNCICACTTKGKRYTVWESALRSGKVKDCGCRKKMREAKRKQRKCVNPDTRQD